MSSPVNDLLHHLDAAYISLLARPTFEMSPVVLSNHLEKMHEVSYKLLKLEVADLSALNQAAAIEHDKLIQAIESLKYATDGDPKYLQLLQGVDAGMHILSGFFKLLM